MYIYPSWPISFIGVFSFLGLALFRFGVRRKTAAVKTGITSSAKMGGLCDCCCAAEAVASGGAAE